MIKKGILAALIIVSLYSLWRLIVKSHYNRAEATMEPERQDVFLKSTLVSEEGRCYQLLLGGSPYRHEYRRGHELQGVAAIETTCP